ncbi:MAG: hypothetical protein V1851_01085 [Patescibacteria group bacterium]
MTNAWEFGIEPFPAYRANLIYGRNKRDREFLPVEDVSPVTEYTVTADYGKTVLYTGSDKHTAEVAKAKYDAAKKAEKPESSWTPTADMKTGLPTLPDGQFRVIKTKEKGTILVVPGNDDTNRCLLFVGCAGGFRGGVSLVKDGTTGNVLKSCSAGNNCESSIEVIALMEVGQSVAFHTSGRRTNEVYMYTWDGEKMKEKHFSKSEWDSRNTVSSVALDDAEVL